MEQLIKGTTAYKIFRREALQKRLAHAYMLLWDDAANLRAALKIFALEFFGAEKDGKIGGQIVREVYPDCRVYPEADKKFNAEAAAKLIEDSAMRPVYGDKKLYLVSSFDECSAAVQNKLLKVIEEPLPGITFILGATSLSPVLPTIISRVRLLEIAPFTAEQIYGALERENPGGVLNRQAAESCGGVLGAAEKLAGGAYSEIRSAAMEILSVKDAFNAGATSLKYADCTYKKQLLAEAGRLMNSAACALIKGGGGEDEKKLIGQWRIAALLRGAELYCEALRDLKFNAYFSALLYSVMLKVIEENDKWQKLSE